MTFSTWLSLDPDFIEDSTKEKAKDSTRDGTPYSVTQRWMYESGCYNDRLFNRIGSDKK